jgi:hypothetical protein
MADLAGPSQLGPLSVQAARTGRRDVEAEGACFFLSIVACEDPAGHECPRTDGQQASWLADQRRTRVVNFMEFGEGGGGGLDTPLPNGLTFRHMIDSEDPAVYFRQMRLPGTWVDMPTAFAACLLYRRHLRVYCPCTFAPWQAPHLLNNFNFLEGIPGAQQTWNMTYDQVHFNPILTLLDGAAFPRTGTEDAIRYLLSGMAPVVSQSCMRLQIRGPVSNSELRLLYAKPSLGNLRAMVDAHSFLVPTGAKYDLLFGEPPVVLSAGHPGLEYFTPLSALGLTDGSLVFIELLAWEPHPEQKNWGHLASDPAELMRQLCGDMMAHAETKPEDASERVAMGAASIARLIKELVAQGVKQGDDRFVSHMLNFVHDCIN